MSTRQGLSRLRAEGRKEKKILAVTVIVLTSQNRKRPSVKAIPSANVRHIELLILAVYQVHSTAW